MAYASKDTGKVWPADFSVGGLERVVADMKENKGDRAAKVRALIDFFQNPPEMPATKETK